MHALSILRLITEHCCYFSHSVSMAGLPSDFPYAVADGLSRLNISCNLLHRPQFKLLTFVYGAEQTSIPGTVPGGPYEQGISLAGGSYGTQLEGLAQFLCGGVTRHLTYFSLSERNRQMDFSLLAMVVFEIQIQPRIEAKLNGTI